MPCPRFALPLLAAASLACAALACAATASADDFGDFRIPVNHALQWTGSTDGNVYWSHGDGVSGHGAQGSEHLGLGTSFYRLDDADTRTSSLSLSLSLGGNRAHAINGYGHAASGSGWLDNQELDASVVGNVNAAWTVRLYPGGSRFYVGGSVTARTVDTRSWTSARGLEGYADAGGYTAERLHSDTQWQHDHLLSCGGALGVGRVRNATGVYEARLLEERLRAAGALTRALGTAARAQLVAFMVTRGNLASVRDRPAPQAWDVIERILRADGALRDSLLGAGAVARATEPFAARISYTTDRTLLPASPILRMRGASAGVVVQEITRLRSSRSETASTVRTDTEGAPLVTFEDRSSTRDAWYDDVTQAGFEGEAHRPLGLRWQLDGVASVMVPVRPHQRGYTLSSQARASWLAADRWLVSAAVYEYRVFTASNGDAAAGSWDTRTDATTEYFVTDHVDATLHFSQDFTRQDGSPSGVPGSWTRGRSGSLAFGVTYRFAGFVDVPALAPFPAN